VCLGHQCMGQAFGGRIVRARRLMHGKTDLIHHDGRGLFAPDEQGCVRAIIEAKWQDTSGSVDEKLPYIWEAFRDSPVHNWVVVLDGRYWKTARGNAAVNWLWMKAGKFDGRSLHVVDRKGFIALAMKAWGQP